MNKENNQKVRIKVRLTEEENEKLQACSVWVAGCGGLGGYIIGVYPPALHWKSTEAETYKRVLETIEYPLLCP